MLFRGEDAFAVIHQQQLRMECDGQCDSGSFALVNAGGKRDGGRFRDFKPGGRSGDPTLNGCRGERVREFGQHGAGKDHSRRDGEEDRCGRSESGN